MWNYRVMRKRDVLADPTNKKEQIYFSYAIHEAYYDNNGKVSSITQESVNPFGDNIEELRHSWVMIAIVISTISKAPRLYFLIHKKCVKFNVPLT